MTTPTIPSRTDLPTTAAGYAAPETARRISGTRSAVIAVAGVLASAGIAAGLFLGLGGGSPQPPHSRATNRAVISGRTSVSASPWATNRGAG